MRTGLDRLATHSKLGATLRSARVGLLAHPASVDRRLLHARHVLEDLGAKIAVVFGPEHGYGGEAQDMIGVADARDALGTPIRSLYGPTFDDLSPRPEDLARIDRLVVDLQDVGARYYTFVWTAVLALRACARAGVAVLVLDRPNPIGGDPASLEGRRASRELCSFVGLEPVAVRHALTLGEIVAWRAEVEGVPKELLQVVPAAGIAREEHAPAWDRPFVMPSPNMPGYDTALVYPGGCLIEGTNLSEGRGTTRPFEIVGAPWIDGARLAAALHAEQLPGMRARPLTFQPTFHKHAGVVCGGVQVHVTDPARFRPYATYVALVAHALRQDPARFAFRTEKYEFRDDVPAFDLLTGDSAVRERMLRGDRVSDVVASTAEVDSTDRAIFTEALQAARSRAVA
ncbi:MAG: exo-beta-N-acetylmuramidase NamZ family protein [Polyangiaceae bacterium]